MFRRTQVWSNTSNSLWSGHLSSDQHSNHFTTIISSSSSFQESSSSTLETRTREINADTERLHQRLRDIAQAVINDEDVIFESETTGRTSPRRLSPLRSADRFDSPERAYSRYVFIDIPRRVGTDRRQLSSLKRYWTKELNLVLFTPVRARTLLFVELNRTRMLLRGEERKKNFIPLSNWLEKLNLFSFASIDDDERPIRVINGFLR